MAMCINGARGTIPGVHLARKCFQLSWCGLWNEIEFVSVALAINSSSQSTWPSPSSLVSPNRAPSEKKCDSKYRLRSQFWRSEFFFVHLPWIRAINVYLSIEWQGKWTAEKVISIRINIFSKWTRERRHKLITTFSRDMFRFRAHNSMKKSIRYTFMLIMNMIIIIILSTRQRKRPHTSAISATTRFRWRKIFPQVP